MKVMVMTFIIPVRITSRASLVTYRLFHFIKIRHSGHIIVHSRDLNTIHYYYLVKNKKTQHEMIALDQTANPGGLQPVENNSYQIRDRL